MYEYKYEYVIIIITIIIIYLFIIIIIKENLSNYRPISNLSTISKIVERVVQSRLSDHLVRSKLCKCVIETV